MSLKERCGTVLFGVYFLIKFGSNILDNPEDTVANTTFFEGLETPRIKEIRREKIRTYSKKSTS